MGSARDEILGRIRAVDRPAPPPVPRDYERARHADDPVELLAERISDYRATVYRAAVRELPYRIAERLDGRGRIAVPPDVPGEWRVPGVAWLPDDPPLGVSDMEEVDGVLSGCALAIAETGTIVLDAGPAQGRRVLTLVPDYHLCVVRADQIVVSVPEAIERLDPSGPLTFISGPSATSDIELDRVEGVHGPRTLEVLLVG
ncbi:MULTISPECIES: LutC/YkgG family protein [Prauserella salsuginis group]|uniref:L-lactate dehydrogenase complex protein LldG n=2 Tax=Prauserella salsuginis group TaxID=2893672 RepID=A0A839XIR0_9PSEU|nr:MULTISPECIES: lactate utilization protein C [Prauserella salsuginis group]MBB3663160.1 L-lactate dehydrogenase complex protein LldG [Prauserella sediminis]MCR3721013.1 L-lactate dehydrogenase complex protein LldG [Prauserella flava]MCR3734906.1 L-lactate dehydrogenase complex protein LldG [Prauserella salsuginis]